MEAKSRAAVAATTSTDARPRLTRRVRVRLGAAAILLAALVGVGAAVLYLALPPRAVPYFEADWATWLTERSPHPGHLEMPVVPAGADGGLVPRALAADLMAEGAAERLALAQPPGPGRARVAVATDDGGFVEIIRFVAGERLFGLSRAGDLFVLQGGDEPRWARVDVTDISAVQHEEEGGSVDLELTEDEVAKAALEGGEAAAALAWSPDGRTLLLAGASTLRSWRVGQEALATVASGLSSPALAVAWSPDGSVFATGHADRTIRAWDAATNRSGQPATAGSGGWITGISWRPDGARLLATDEERVGLQFWTLQPGDVPELTFVDGYVPTVTVLPALRWASGIVSAAWSPWQDVIATVSGDGNLDFLLFDGESYRPAAEASDEVRSAVGFEAKDASPSAGGGPSAVAFSPDGRLLAWASPDLAVVENRQTGERYREYPGRDDPSAMPIAWAPNGRMLALPSAIAGVSVYRADLTLLADVANERSSDLLSIAWSPDGRRLATAGANGRITVWSVAGVPLIRDVASAPGGRRILVGGDAGLLALYDPDAPAPGWRWEPGVEGDLVAVDMPGDTVAWAATPDGQLFAMLDGEGWASVANAPAANVADIDFLDARSGWVAGSDGTIAITADGAVSWGSVVPEGVASLDSIYIQPPAAAGGRAAGWAHGADAEGRPVVVRAEDAADPESWEVLDHGRVPPIAFALLGLWLLLLFAGGRLILHRAPEDVQAVRQTQTADAPLGERDPDVLGLRPIARALSFVMRNRDTAPPLTIAVQGSWGTGKSSLMNLLCIDLRRFHSRPVWFNAWHHQSEEHLLAALLERIRGEAIPGWWRTSGLGFRWRLFRRRIVRAGGGAMMAIPLLLLFVLGVELFVRGDLLASGVRWVLAPTTSVDFGLFSLDAPGQETETETEIAGWVTGILGGAIPLALVLWLRSLLAGLTARPSALLAQVGRFALMPRFTDSLSFREKFGRQFGDVCWALRRGNNPGLVVVIDDLDRCQPEQVLEILEAINYLTSVGTCFIVIGMDRFQVEHCVGSAFKDLVDSMSDDDFREAHGLPAGERGDAEGADEDDERLAKHRRYAQNYLKKLINVEIDIPRMTADHVALMFVGDTAGEAPAGQSIERAPVVRWTQRLLRFAGEIAPAAASAVVLAWIVADTIDWSPILGRPPEPSATTQGQAVAEADDRDIGGDELAVTDDPEGPAAGDSQTSDPLAEDPPAGPAYEVEILDSLADTDYGLRAIEAATLALLVVVGILFVRFLRRRRLLQPRDPPDFAAALVAVRELVFATEHNPRGVKRFQNRMRILSALQQPQPEQASLIDMFFERLGRALRRPFVRIPPGARGGEGAPVASPDGIGYPQLVMLGAIEPHLSRLAVGDDATEEERFRQWLSSSQGVPRPDDLEVLWAQARRQYAERHGSHPVFELPDDDDIRAYVRISRGAKG